MTIVVIPVYNAAHVLEWSVPVALAVRGVDAFVWVDDGSTDETAALLGTLLTDEPRARVVRLPENRGRSAARNAGVAAAGASGAPGDVLVFLDGDVRPPPDLAERFADALGAPGAIATVATFAFHGLGSTDPYHLYLQRQPRGVRDAAPGTPVPWKHFVTAACAVRRDAFALVGGFDERVLYGEDLAFGCALAVGAPRGLVASGVTAEMTDAGTLVTALAKVAAFGRLLPLIAEGLPNIYQIAGLDAVVRPTAASRVAAWAPLARAVRWALPYLPAAGRVRAVRYLLGHTLLDAYADARPHARDARARR